MYVVFGLVFGVFGLVWCFHFGSFLVFGVWVWFGLMFGVFGLGFWFRLVFGVFSLVFFFYFFFFFWFGIWGLDLVFGGLGLVSEVFVLVGYLGFCFRVFGLFWYLGVFVWFGVLCLVWCLLLFFVSFVVFGLGLLVWSDPVMSGPVQHGALRYNYVKQVLSVAWYTQWIKIEILLLLLTCGWNKITTHNASIKLTK